jgi:protein gp37
MAQRLAGRYGYRADDPFRVTVHPDRLDEPLHWRKPRRVFVCSMGDLFHAVGNNMGYRRCLDVPLRFIEEVWRVMVEAPQHRYLILTKRPQRMLDAIRAVRGWWNCAGGIFLPPEYRVEVSWPMPNVWLGVTAENQKCANERIPILLQTPAVVRFVSVEPMLGPIDRDFSDFDWIICGGESGANNRLFSPHWAIDLYYSCYESKVPFFMKQDSGRFPGKQGRIPDWLWQIKEIPNGRAE